MSIKIGVNLEAEIWLFGQKKEHGVRMYSNAL